MTAQESINNLASQNAEEQPGSHYPSNALGMFKRVYGKML